MSVGSSSGNERQNRYHWHLTSLLEGKKVKGWLYGFKNTTVWTRALTAKCCLFQWTLSIRPAAQGLLRTQVHHRPASPEKGATMEDVPSDLCCFSFPPPAAPCLCKFFTTPPSHCYSISFQTGGGGGENLHARTATLPSTLARVRNQLL